MFSYFRRFGTSEASSVKKGLFTWSLLELNVILSSDEINGHILTLCSGSFCRPEVCVELYIYNANNNKHINDCI